MRRLAPLLAVLAIAIIAVPATAAPRSKLLTFGTGDVTLVGRDGATLDNDSGEFSGVYLKKQGARHLRGLSFSFDYAGDIAGGAPRFSIPIDTDHNATTDNGYAFVDAINCGDTGTVSTTDPDCKVFFGSDVYDNWADFAAANPKYRIPPRGIPFVIADQPGHYALTNIDLR